MAERLEGYVFDNRQKHPWAKWMNGSTWRLRRGEDFTCTMKSFRVLIYRRAKEAGLHVHISEREADAFVIQAYKKDAG